MIYGMPSFLNRPSRWWVWLTIPAVLVALQLADAAERSPHVVRFTALRAVATVGVYVLLIGPPIFRAGALWSEHRRESGRSSRLQ